MALTILIRVFSLVCSVFLLILSGSTANKEAEALLEWKSSLQNQNPSPLLPSWAVSDPVNATTSPCNWSGISCNNAGRVESINLTRTGLRELAYTMKVTEKCDCIASGY
ncbi:hypothetical protein QYF36_023884 [Acer negundo]|nr:hypothetical protein QYF36_023884 [Acer negundo]